MDVKPPPPPPPPSTPSNANPNLVNITNPTPTSSNYIATAEVEKAIKYVLNFKNPFDIFDLEDDASLEEIQKKYKRVALLIHPDKCKHPKATEAFSSKFFFLKFVHQFFLFFYLLIFIHWRKVL
jgi:hypothetical protein